MSIGTSFYRNGRWVELEDFSNYDVSNYLKEELNKSDERFFVIAKPRFSCNILAEYDGVSFLMYARNSYIELAFAKKNYEKMKQVIEALTKWDKFSKTEPTFYVEKEQEDAYIVIFENGYASYGDYKRYFQDNQLKITRFKVD